MKTNKYKINNFYDEYLNNKNNPRKSFEASFNFFDLLSAKKKETIVKSSRFNNTFHGNYISCL